MPGSDTDSDIRFGEPTVYRIVVQGTLSDDWADRLAGMAVTTTHQGGAPRTTLVGRIQDQAELDGVLSTLFGLHLPILLLERVSKGQ